ncbi:phytochelatin synthase family protein [Variovorax sp. LjRoot130]|uniref:phytochelatin synthase family protein n=1 Tax=Variovorax sp. LjRoot130 TaxID=3342261 RepID=UPI003F5169FB
MRVPSRPSALTWADNLTRGGDHVIVNFRRKTVGQKGGGHISPLSACDAASDSFSCSMSTRL